MTEEALNADDWLGKKSVVNLPGYIPTDPREYEMMHPKDMREMIDSVVKAVDKATVQRSRMTRVKWQLHWEKVFLEFGQWSHVFNKTLRKLIKDTEGEDKDESVMDLHLKYTYVYSYWWNRMHFVNTILSSKSRLSGGGVKKGIERGRQTLVKLINGEVEYTELHQDFQSLIAKLRVSDFASALGQLINLSKGDK